MGKYENAEGYHAYMGGWSESLTSPFLKFAAIENVERLLDVGAGTGNLLLASTRVFRGAEIIGIDPSGSMLRAAKKRAGLEQAMLVVGDAQVLPFVAAGFDCCLSLLVLQEFADLSAALSEMRRVTRVGGVVAACVWDFPKMPVIAALVEAICSVDPVAGKALASNSYDDIGSEAGLDRSWAAAGFNDVLVARLRTSRRFTEFEELWQPLLTGSTPSTLALSALSESDRERVRLYMTRLLGEGRNAFFVTAEALVVRGTV